MLFVPLESSLSDNAPGYDSSSSLQSLSVTVSVSGPLCWKCDGLGVRQHANNNKSRKDRRNSSRNSNSNSNASNSINSNESTSNSNNSSNERSNGNDTYCNNNSKNSNNSNDNDNDDDNIDDNNSISIGIDTCKVCRGEKRLAAKKDTRGRTCLDSELCSLVADWKIFQKPRGHRWTTDDLVTAWAAVQAANVVPLVREWAGSFHINRGEPATLNHLDLGCGNGSVLMMVAKHLAPLASRSIGIEARCEAVELATRSIEYNCSLTEVDRDRSISVRNGDFRTLTSPNIDSLLPEGPIFDIVTGTPPYFRVQFDIDQSTKHVEQAVIRQGGMPTCKESAPARCEFRGGIEAYCDAALVSLSPTGVFVVCENYLNHERVLSSAVARGLKVCSIQRVIGKEGKMPLFCVYTMVRNDLFEALAAKLHNSIGLDETPEVANLCKTLLPSSIQQPDLIVRNKDGAWTSRYANVLREISYPVRSLHPSGRY